MAPIQIIWLLIKAEKLKGPIIVEAPIFKKNDANALSSTQSASK